MADLAVLFPLPQRQAEYAAMLKPDAMLPKALFQGESIGLAYDSMRAVGFRVDPCSGSACEPQLRIIFQPVSFDPDTGAFAQDAAVHATYSLTRNELGHLVGELAAARGEGDLGPLAPHPTIAAQGLDGAFATAIDKILLAYATPAKLARLTQFNVELTADINNRFEAWELDSFTVSGTTVTEHAIPSLPDGETRMQISATTDPLVSSGSPATTSANGFAMLADSTQATMATHDQIQAAFSAALHVENPKLENPDTIDCASCHLAGPAIELVGMPMGLTGDAFVPAAAIPVADLARTTPLSSGSDSLNIHAFSYRGATPMINQRVINDTAASLAYLLAE